MISSDQDEGLTIVAMEYENIAEYINMFENREENPGKKEMIIGDVDSFKGLKESQIECLQCLGRIDN